MGDNGKRSLTLIKNSAVIKELLENLLYKKKKLNYRDAEYLYSVALMLINEFQDKGRKDKLLVEYAYFIIAKVAFKINDYHALYDFSINFGYYPVARKITELNLIEGLSLNRIFSEADIENFKNENKILTFEQKMLFKDVLNDENKSLSFLAPTSYGKSELIFSHLKKNNEKNFVVIIVPTKALIDQVFREAKENVNDRKIIIHDQNFNPDTDRRVLAVVTQERALRLLEDGMVFDIIYVDEAHEMLKFDFKNKYSNRSLILTRTLNIARSKNTDLQELYLSPVVQSADSFQIKDSREVNEHKVTNDLKLLDLNYVHDRKHFIYDKYLPGLFIILP